ncbi:MAG: hypothetical protein R3E89_12430 [Thiolinea sp.]
MTETGIAEVMASTTPKQARFLVAHAFISVLCARSRSDLTDGYRRAFGSHKISVNRPKNNPATVKSNSSRPRISTSIMWLHRCDCQKLGRRAERPDEKTRLLLALCMCMPMTEVFMYMMHSGTCRKFVSKDVPMYDSARI